jgi:hypothetical protein
MMVKAILDTDILSEYLKGHNAASQSCRWLRQRPWRFHLHERRRPRDRGDQRARLLRFESSDIGVLNELIEGLESEDLSPGGQNKLLHILAPHAETAAGNAGDN